MWKDQLQPLLLKRFPNSTEQDLQKAHAYAYGGCLLQDMGYYPFGNKFFSDLVHYVRSGDFVEALLEDSSDLERVRLCARRACPIIPPTTAAILSSTALLLSNFPSCERNLAITSPTPIDPKAHIRTEFGFDMAQVAKNRYTSDRYHDMIGFEVSKPLVERAFFETYGLKLDDVFGSVDLAIGSYRRSVSALIPEMTRVALLSRRDVIVKEAPDFNKKKFLYNLSRSNYEHEWGTVYRKPGVGSRILAFFLRLMPKVGPFKAVSFQIPTRQTEDMYFKSVNDTVENYTRLLSHVGHDKLDLPNRDCDTGRETRAGEYGLTDKTYAHLVDQLSSKSSEPLNPGLREDVLKFYADLNAPIATRKDAKAWQQLQDQLQRLKERRRPAGTTCRPESVNGS